MLTLNTKQYTLFLVIFTLCEENRLYILF